MIMSDFKDKIRFLRDEFIQEDRRGSYNDFGMMKKQLIQEFFKDEPLFTSSMQDRRHTEKQSSAGNDQINNISSLFCQHINFPFFLCWTNM